MEISWVIALFVIVPLCAGGLTCCSTAAEYSLTAEFSEGDPAFDWILAFLVSPSICFKPSCFDCWTCYFDHQSKQQAWRNSWNFKISAKTLQRKNGVEASQICKGHKSENAEYVPTYQNPQLFRWKGYWIEISKTLSSSSYNYQEDRSISSSTFYLTWVVHFIMRYSQGWFCV